MGDYQNIVSRKGKYFTAIVVRDTGNGNKVFHKYRNIDQDTRKVERFQRNMYLLDAARGKLIHINYYDKETASFSFQWVCNWG
jgi:hypothetical protein